MKNKITPRNRELLMREEDFIVSKTDTTGRITYANRIFMEFAGYSETELLGGQHNIVRHPDMPRAFFLMMWESIKANTEFLGYIKNLAKDGSYYWTFANVSPAYDSRRVLLGYYSVRRKPATTGVEFLAPVYKEMCAVEHRMGTQDGIGASRRILEAVYSERRQSYDEFVLSL